WGLAPGRLPRRALASENLPSCRADAEDIVQDALVIVLTNRDRTKIDSVYDYLCAVIRNRVRDLSRRKTATPLDTTAPTAEGHKALWVSDIEPDIDAALDAGREADRVLSTLSPQQRRLILLAEGWDYTHAEIAQITSLNRGTVATHIRRAKIALTTGAAAVTAVIVAEIISRIRVGESRPRWVIGSAPWFNSPNLAGPVLAIAAPLAAAYLLLTLVRRRTTRRKARNVRDTQVLNAMVQASSELAKRHAPAAPTPTDYAAHLGIPEEWITLNTIANGQLHQPVGTTIPLACKFGSTLVDNVIVGSTRNFIASDSTHISPSSTRHDSTPGRGYGGDGAEGAP
ncbi:RNA polymerase sigma factor, partial [Streptomyces roseolus]|uniref:RNA polymerase sigma factor n=1 Tax=Streptomyces roseolus TaxID=67358 RepID=UPI00364AD322